MSWVNDAVHKRPFLTVILLLGTTLRTIGINNISPPGLAHDEVANWLINRSILDGNHAIYFTRAYGHEAGFHYLQTGSMMLFGDNTFALRLPSALAGILGIAVSFALIRKLFGRKTAVYATLIHALLFFPIFYSRLGLRAILLPVTAGLSAYYWLVAWGSPMGRLGEERLGDYSKARVARSRALSSLLPFTLAALFAGLSLNIYLAARALPIFYALWFVYLALTDWAIFRQKLWGILWFTAVFALLTTPLILFLQNNPDAEFRVAEVNEPLNRLLAGDFQPVLQNGFKLLGMFGLQGDPLWRQNVAFAPVFEPFVGLLFYIGLLLVIFRWRKPNHAFLLLWTAVSITPSLVTINAPSTIRIVLILPLLTAFPAIVIHSYTHLSTVIPNLSTDLGKIRGYILLTILFVYAVRSAWFTFYVWPVSDEVSFVWQAAFREIAAQLKATPESAMVSVAGWSADTLDSPTMTLLFDNNPPPISFFNPQDGTVILNGDGEDTAVYIPTILDLPQSPLTQLDIQTISETANSKQLSVTSDPHPCNTQHATCNLQPTTFGNQIQLTQIRFSSDNQPITYWQTLTTQQQPMRLFMQLLNENEEIIGEDYRWDNLDPQGLWFSHWQANARIIQAHTPNITEETHWLRIGIFNPYSCIPEPCENLETETNEPFILIPVR